MRLPAHNTQADHAANEAFAETWYGANLGRIMRANTRAAETVTYTETPARLTHNDLPYWAHYQQPKPEKPAQRWPLAARALLWTLTTAIAISIAAPLLGLLYGIGHINGLWP